MLIGEGIIVGDSVIEGVRIRLDDGVTVFPQVIVVERTFLDDKLVPLFVIEEVVVKSLGILLPLVLLHPVIERFILITIINNINRMFSSPFTCRL